MRFENQFVIDLPIGRAWDVLTDLPRIAPCLPGAELTEVVGDEHRGRLRTRVGPVVATYAGTARFSELDAAARRAVIDARGKDVRGTGTASALVTAELADEDGQTVVRVSTDLRITGKIAQFGSGVVREVSALLLDQFAQNLKDALGGEQEPVQGQEQGDEPEPVDLIRIAGRATGRAVRGRALATATAAAGAAAVAAVVVLAARRRRDH